MTEAAKNPAEQPIPTVVDVTPQPGRRVRTQEGSLLPENHVLRGEPRSSYWIRAERDGDVKLAPHQPEVAEPAPAIEPAASPSAEAAPEKSGRARP